MTAPLAAVFLPWWGPSPPWVVQFLERAADIRTVIPILLGDAAAWESPAPVERIPCTMDEFEQQASITAGVPVKKRDPRYWRGQALCELRPLLGAMYADVIASYPWWGYGDWDVVWGDWDAFLTGPILSYFDIISTNPWVVNAPFTLFRNVPLTRDLYRHRLDAVQAPLANAYLDEVGMSEIVATHIGVGGLRVLYPGGLNGHDRMVAGLTHCVLIDGKLYRADAEGRPAGHELLKFHFPGTKQWPVLPPPSPIADHRV